MDAVWRGQRSGGGVTAAGRTLSIGRFVDEERFEVVGHLDDSGGKLEV